MTDIPNASFSDCFVSKSAQPIKAEVVHPTNEFSLDPEIYDGNTEYKLMIKPDKKRKLGLKTQMGFRLREGNGHAIYWIGIMDNGYALGTIKSIIDESIKHLKDIAESLDARIKILSLTNIGNNTDNLGVNLKIPFWCKVTGYNSDPTAEQPPRFIASIEVTTSKSEVDYETVTIGVMGNANAGKSTLIGTLVTGEEDDGNGKNRNHILNHLHEITTGRTSSTSHIILGFQSDETIKYYEPTSNWDIITKESSKIVKFFDLAGHEKCLKTTIKGLIHNKPNYVIITIEANKGITDITKQHIALCRSHNVPFMILITKVDIVNRQKYVKTERELGAMLKTHFQLMANPICDMDDAIRIAEQLHMQTQKKQPFTKGQVTTSNLVPVLDISCVTGEGMALLKKVLYRLKPNRKYNPEEQVEYYLENIYDKVDGVGLVVSGLLTSGTVTKGQQLTIGPDTNGQYIPIKIKGIHVDKHPVDKVTAGHHCSFALSTIKKKKKELKGFVTKDMVILDDLVTPLAYNTISLTIKMANMSEFLTAKLKKITLGVDSSFVIQINNIRRAVTIKEIRKINKQDNTDSEARIVPGDKAKIIVELDNKNPAYIKKRDMCVLTESHMFGVGIVNDVIS